MRRPRPTAAAMGPAAAVRLFAAALWLPRELRAAQRLTPTVPALPPELAILADESAEVLFTLDPAEDASRAPAGDLPSGTSPVLPDRSPIHPPRRQSGSAAPCEGATSGAGDVVRKGR